MIFRVKMLGLIVFSLFLPAVELSKDHVLHIVALAAYPDNVTSPSWDGGASLTPAAIVAVNEINNDSSILPDYRLELIDRDDGCDLSFKAVTSFVESSFYSDKQVVGMVGPGCSEAALAIGGLSTHDSITTLMVSVATTVELINRTAYPYILRTVSTSYIYVKAYFELMVQNKWKNVAVLFDYYRTYFSYTFYKFRDEFAATITNGSITFVGGVTRTYFPLDALVQSHSRIILGFLGGELAPQLLCLAYHKKIYYPAYQWVFHDRSVNEFENGKSFTLVDPSCPGGQCSCSGWDFQVVLKNAIFCHYKLERDFSDNTTLISGENFTEFFNKYSPAVNRYIQEKRWNPPLDLLYGPTYYDTVWSLARALDLAVRRNNVSLKDYWPARGGISQLQTTKTILARFFDEDFSFEGASGRIAYSIATGDTNTAVEVYQLYTNSVATTASRNLLGVFNGTKLPLLSSGNFIPDKFETELVALNIYAAGTFIVLLIVALVWTVSLHIINVVYRYTASIKATSPKLNHVIFIGCYMIMAATMIFIVSNSFKSHTSNISLQGFLCNAFWWLMVLGFTLIFGIIITRLWRIYRIFTHFQNPGNHLSNYHLLGFVGLLVCTITIFLVVWAVTDPLRYQLLSSSIPNFRILEYWDCNCKYFIFWILALLIFLAVLLGIMVTLAFLTRHVTNANFKYTKSTALLVYVLGVMLYAGVPIYAVFLHSEYIDLSDSVMCIVLVGSICTCNVFIFLPPVISLCTERSTVYAVQNKQALSMLPSV